MKMILVFLSLMSVNSWADAFSDQVKVGRCQCQDDGKMSVEFRSLDRDYVFFLAKNEVGLPQYLVAVLSSNCQKLMGHLNDEYKDKILTLNFETEDFVKTQKVFIEPKPCHGTKCSDGYYVDRQLHYIRTETRVDHLRLFNEAKQ